mgnify:CR=1 FL=1
MKTELSNIKEVDKVIEEILEQEEIQYTCCGDEITGEVEDIGLCPSCDEELENLFKDFEIELEHI